MSNETPFLIYCIESYKNAKGLTGKETLELFNQYAVCDYITLCYDVLHTTGEQYIIEDIDIFIKNRQGA